VAAGAWATADADWKAKLTRDPELGARFGQAIADARKRR
jgi:hypothetical protein